MSRALPPVQWRRSKRARRIRIALCPWRGIEIVIPRRASEAQAQAFLESRRDWMESAWARLQRRVPEAFDTRAPDRLELPALGRDWTIDYVPERERVQEADGVLTVPGPRTPETASTSLRPWLMKLAKAVLPDWTAHIGERTGLKHARVQIRDQRTRWGSCSSKGTISLNFRVLFHRPRVVDYLILHELCHTRHMNHGPRFHALVARHEPDWKVLDAELTKGSGGIPGWLGW